ncbi:PREDICTED: SAFB-like transcription modulator [Rhagoletis zephyria]|uniref:SAFB-like transcription modulator n=1 Tax=Rhagoletis zephyria TaxID=28612 RepID=UPI0008114151|nr:PREDICTED: SAFB-like transcription modulator [Rhagoletis zephyria]
MAKIQDLKIEELKQELEKRNLATSGRNVELLSRLREAMEKEGIDVDKYDFHREDYATSTKDEQKDEMSSPLEAEKMYMSSQLDEKITQLEQNLFKDNAELRERQDKIEERQDKIEELIKEKVEAKVEELEGRLRDMQLNRPPSSTSANKNNDDYSKRQDSKISHQPTVVKRQQDQRC